MLRKRGGRLVCVLGLSVLLLAGSAGPVDALVALGSAGRLGGTSYYWGGCKYGSAPFPGYLRISTPPPLVTGIASRRGREMIRYGAWLVDAGTGSTIQFSGWSGLLSVRGSRWKTWSGETAFTADWRGNYRIDIRVEWWNRRLTRRIGWRADRITDYGYIDEWGTNWGGPFTSCMRQPT